MTTKARVAICQPSIILGGRLNVIVGLIQILNEMGIVPDILAFEFPFSEAQIRDLYGEPIQFNYRRISYPTFVRPLPQDFAILLHHLILKLYAVKYDLLIYTSNSLIFLPQRANILVYMFYPRKSRIVANVESIHTPHLLIRPLTLRWLEKSILRQIYRLSKYNPRHRIICMTEFTRSALEHVYAIPTSLPVVYPQVKMEEFQAEGQNRDRAIVTIGRFTPEKRQLEQIKLAKQMPDIIFRIVGFVDNSNYFRQCQEYVLEHSVSNVRLYPNAPFDQLRALLKQSKYFLHTLINEPFGITAVQAISAGCIPIVHNSGGQTETVDEPRLRYDKLDEVPDIIRWIESVDVELTDTLLRRLQIQAQEKFDSAVFHDKMSTVLQNCLNGR